MPALGEAAAGTPHHHVSRPEHRRRRAANLKRRAQCFVAESKWWITSLGLSELHLHPDIINCSLSFFFGQIFVFKDIG